MKTIKWISTLLAVVLGVSALCACGKDFPKTEDSSRGVYDVNTGVDLNSPLNDVVKDGKSEYVILLRDGFGKPEDFASKELASFIEQATGVRLTVTTDRYLEPSQKVISIGRTARLADSVPEFDYASLNNDGFFIKTESGSIYIDGGNDRSRIYGVYEFLERFVGVRFVTPVNTYVPDLESLSVHELNIVEIPAFRQRNFYNGTIFSDSQFQVRMRMYSDLSYPNENYGYESEWCKKFKSDMHNAIEYVPYEIYGEQHPEFYSLKTNPGTKYIELCYTNGITEEGEIDDGMDVSVAKIVLQSLKRYAAESPNAKFFMIGKSDDRTAFCKCKTCVEREQKFGGKSGTMAVFMNAIAREIEKWAKEEQGGREINVVFFAYQFTEMPPTKIENGRHVPVSELVRLEPNVYVRIAPISANYAVGFADERQEDFYKQVFEGWGELTDNLMVWDYTTNYSDYSWYMPNLNYMQKNLQFYQDRGTVYVMNQSSYDTRGDWQSDLKLYLASKLYWHTNYDFTRLMNEFLLLQYGEIGSEYVRRFITLMEDHMAVKVGKGMKIATLPTEYDEYLQPQTYPLPLLEKGISLLETAISETLSCETLTEKEKNLFTTNLSGVLLTPQRMILKNYSAYYVNGKRDFADTFYNNCAVYGMTRVAEYVPIVKDKVDLGLSV